MGLGVLYSCPCSGQTDRLILLSYPIPWDAARGQADVEPGRQGSAGERAAAIFGRCGECGV